MNAHNPLESTRRLEASGLARAQAEAIASEINDGTNVLVTKEQLEAALDRQTIKLGGFVTAMIAVATTVLGFLISFK